MSYKKRILLIFIIATLFSAIMYVIKEGSKSDQIPGHGHKPGIIEEHGH